MRKAKSILWGAALVLISMLLVLNSFDLIDLNLFFKGWWTLFIIVPCFIGLFTSGDKTGNIIGVCVGVVLLLGCQSIIEFKIIQKLIFPLILAIFGISLIIKAVFVKNKNLKISNNLSSNDKKAKVSCAIFSGQDINFDNEYFNSAELIAIFGGIKLDLRNAVFENDAFITAVGIFGGIDILLPDNVNVKLNSTAVFGGTDNKKSADLPNSIHTVYINSTCIFGGVDIK